MLFSNWGVVSGDIKRAQFMMLAKTFPDILYFKDLLTIRKQSSMENNTIQKKIFFFLGGGGLEKVNYFLQDYFIVYFVNIVQKYFWSEKGIDFFILNSVPFVYIS